jgi:hypothetical protein
MQRSGEVSKRAGLRKTISGTFISITLVSIPACRALTQTAVVSLYPQCNRRQGKRRIWQQRSPEKAGLYSDSQVPRYIPIRYRPSAAECAGPGFNFTLTPLTFLPVPAPNASVYADHSGIAYIVICSRLLDKADCIFTRFLA